MQSEVFPIIQWVVIGILAISSVLAWVAKLRWSKEYQAAKDEVIKAHQAQIDLLRDQVRILETLSPMKIREYFQSVKTQLEEYNDTLNAQLTAAHEAIQQRETELKSLKVRDNENLQRMAQLEKELDALREMRSILEKELEQLRKEYDSDRVLELRVPALDPILIRRAIDAIARLEAEFNWGTFGGVPSHDVRGALLMHHRFLLGCVSPVKCPHQRRKDETPTRGIDKPRFRDC